MLRQVAFLAAATITVAAGPAFALPVVGETAGARTDEVRAEAASEQRDWIAAAAEAARAYRRSPSVENEYNLALAYENSGRATLAIPLYRDVAARGQSSIGVALYDYRHDAGPEHKTFYFADVAAAHLEGLTGVPVKSSVDVY